MDVIGIPLAALVTFIIGFLWHGPLFGKMWMKLMKITPPKNPDFSMMMKPMILNFIMNLVIAFVFSNIVTFSSSIVPFNWIRGAILGLFLAVFPIAAISNEWIWLKRPVSWWLFEVSNYFVMYAAMGAVLGAL